MKKMISVVANSQNNSFHGFIKFNNDKFIVEKVVMNKITGLWYAGKATFNDITGMNERVIMTLHVNDKSKMVIVEQKDGNLHLSKQELEEIMNWLTNQPNYKAGWLLSDMPEVSLKTTSMVA